MYRLRELERRDLPEINRWRNDPELVAYLGSPFRYINMDTDEEWFENYQAHRSEQVRCAITDEADRILGLVSLVGINQIQQLASFHLMIGNKEHQNKGMGSFAVQEILKHAFMNLNLHRVELGVLEDNARARHLYEKSGFVLEGIKRQAVYKNGTFCDVCLYAILRQEFCEMTRLGGSHSG